MTFSITHPQPGRYTDLPIRDYFAAHNTISRSSLNRLEEGTPLELAHYMANGIKETDAMRLGSAVDMMVFEPHLMDAEMVKRPVFGRSRAAQLEKEQWELENNEKLVLTEVQWTHAERMAIAVKEARCVRALMAGANAQESFFWRESNTLLKTRPDGLDEAAGISFDLKTARSLDDRHIAQAIVDYGYDAQAAMNCAGMRANGLNWKGHVLIFVGKSDPIDVRAVVIEDGDNWALYGELRYKRWLRIYEECVRTNNWPGHDTGVSKLRMPGWVAQKLTNEEELERAQRREGSAA